MLNKDELRQKKNHYISLRNEKESVLKDLNADKERLQQAINNVENILEDFSLEKKNYEAIEIKNNEWKGVTRVKSDGHRDDLDEAIETYNKKYSKIVEQMNKDLEYLNNKIIGVQREIVELTQRIDSLERQIAND